MKKYVIILLSIVLVSACTNPQEKLFRQIKNMEQSDTIGTPEGLAALAELHKEYGLKYEDSMANNYLYAAAMYYFFSKDKSSSKALFLEYITRGDSQERQRNAYYSLANIYGENQQYDSFDIMSDLLIDNHVPSPQQWRTLLNFYEAKIDGGKDIRSNDYERLSLAYTALGSFELALTSLDSAIAKFPSSDNRANLMYRAGFIAWDYLKDPQKAKNYYEAFINEYPNHELAAEAKNILESGMIEMSDEDILQMLKAKGA